MTAIINLLMCLRFIAVSSIALLVIAGPSSASESGISLPELVEEGWRTNNALAGLRNSIDALKLSAKAAGALDDPKIGLALLNMPTDTFDFRQEPMTQKQLSLSQRFPWFGTLSLKTQGVMLQAIEKEALWLAKRNELARRISEDYWSLAFIDRGLAVNDQLTEMVSQLLKVVETRYATGKGLQQDVLQGQVELSRLLEERLTLTQNRRVVESRLNATINRPAYQPIQPILDGPLPETPQYAAASLKARVLMSNPWLAAKRVAMDQADVDIDLAEKEYFPDFNFRLAYGQRDPAASGESRADFLSAGVVMRIPLWQAQKQDRRLAAAKKRKAAARRAYVGLADSLPHRAEAMIAEINALRETHSLYTDAIRIQAAQWAQSALAAYEVGKLEFNTMMAAQIRLLKVELKQDDYRFALFRKHAELAEILGESDRRAQATHDPDGSVVAVFDPSGNKENSK